MKTVLHTACLLFFCFLGSGLTYSCFGQPTQNEVLPPSPNAAALGSYGTVPVSTYTGTTNISIPLATIKTKAHTLDLSLSYRSGGIRVGDEASWVGLGWTLNAGGVITRSIRGIDDLNEVYPGFPIAGALPSSNATNDYASNPGNATQTHADYQYFRNVVCGTGNTIDVEPDIFYFNFCGHSGKFVLDKSPNLNALNVRMIESSDNSKFVYTKSATGFPFDDQWMVTTTDGYKYQFYGYNEGSRADGSNFEHVSAWYLNKIVAPDGEEVRFVYRASGSITQDFLTESMHTVFARTFSDESKNNMPIAFTCGTASYNYANSNLSSSYSNAPQGCSWNSNDPAVGDPMPDEYGAPDPITRSGSKFIIHGSILSKIIYTNGEIEFSSSTRQDLKTTYNGPMQYGGQPYKINDITIRATDGATPRVLKKITFLNNNYFNESLRPLPNINLPEAAYWRLRLDGIVESGPNTLGATYSFTYYPGNLPPKTTWNRDYLGFYNKVSQYDNDALPRPNAIPKIQVFTTGLGTSPVPLPGANRDPNLASTLIGTLQSIRYPTGGTTTFEYELHQFAQPSTPTTIQDGCGLRIKKVTTTASATAAKRIKWYGYTQPATGYCSGKLMAPGNYGVLPGTGILGIRASDECGSNPTYRKLWLGVKRFSESNIPLGNSAQGQNYGYSVVTEWEGNDSTVANGKTVFYYHNEPETVPVSPYVINVPTQIDPLNGTIDHKLVYKRVGSSFQAVTAADYTYYMTNPFPDVKAAKINMYMFGCNIGNSFSPDCEAYLMSTSVKYYYIRCFWTRLASVTERIFDMNDATRSRYVETTTAYTYNTAHRQPIMVAKTLPDGTVERVYTTYPKDYLNIPSTSPVGAMADASRLNMQATPIETYSTLTRPAGAEQLIKGQFTAFDFTGPTLGTQWVVPQRVDQTQLATPIGLTSGTFTASTAPSLPQPDSRYYRTQQSFGYETTTGNLLRQQKPNDVPTSYQWEYGNSLISAAFVNADRTMPDASNPLLGNEASYLGFETGKNINQDPAADYWSNLGINRDGNYVVSDAHTGQYALRVGEVYPGGVNPGPTRTFQPTQRTARYKLSAWVKTESASFAANAGRLALRVLRANGTAVTTATQEVRFGPTQGTWSYVEVILDLGAVQQQLGLGANPEALQLVATIDNLGDGNGNPVAYLVDDIRFQPVLSQVTTYTYDLATRQPTSVSDINNQPTYYQYDDLQRLVFVRDYLKQIIKHYTYHYQR